MSAEQSKKAAREPACFWCGGPRRPGQRVWRRAGTWVGSGDFDYHPGCLPAGFGRDAKSVVFTVDADLVAKGEAPTVREHVETMRRRFGVSSGSASSSRESFSPEEPHGLERHARIREILREEEEEEERRRRRREEEEEERRRRRREDDEWENWAIWDGPTSHEGPP